SGTSNRERPQGQVVITGTRITNSLNYGIDIATPGRDPVTNAPLLGAPRNTVTLNVDGLAPGAVVMNSEFISNGEGGIRISGEPTVAGMPPAAVPFVRLINNTIVGGTI